MSIDTEPKCVECGHERAAHWDNWGGICIGCPCSGWKEPAEELAPPPDEP